jgi:outer membrane autotransporter protein
MMASNDLSWPQGGNAADGSELAREIPFGFYANTFGGTSEKDTTDGEDGFDANSGGISVGGEYRVRDDLVVGASIGYQSTSSDFTSNVNVAGGGLDSSQVTLSAYGLYFNEDRYLDFVFSLGRSTYELERRVVIANNDGDPTTNEFDQTATADTDGQYSRLSFGGGKEFVRGRVTIAPFGRMSLINVGVDGYQETGADELDLLVQDQDITSFTIGGGARVVGTFSTPRAIVLPQVSLEWVHEVKDDSRQIVSSYVHDPRGNELIVVTDNPDKNYFIGALGVSAVFQNKVQVYGELRSLLGLNNINQTLLAGGFRYEF